MKNPKQESGYSWHNIIHSLAYRLRKDFQGQAEVELYCMECGGDLEWEIDGGTSSKTLLKVCPCHHCNSYYQELEQSVLMAAERAVG